MGIEWVENKIFPLIDTYKLSVEDILRTFVEHIAIQISDNLKGTNLRILITGGGVKNVKLQPTAGQVEIQGQIYTPEMGSFCLGIHIFAVGTPISLPS